MHTRPRPRQLGPVLRFCVLVVVPLTSVVFRRQWRHGNRLPAAGPVIVAANHVSYADPFVVARFVWDNGRVPRFLGKSSIFAVPGVGWILERVGQIPVQRASLSAAESLDAAAAALRRGEVVVIYPEGTVTRDPDFWPMTAKTGVARLARSMPAVPVVPLGQWGTQDAVDVYRHRYRLFGRTTVTVSLGMPVDLARFAAAPATEQTLRAMTDTIMTAVRQEVADIRGLDPPTAFAPRPAPDGPAPDRPPSDRPPPERPPPERPPPDRPPRDRPPRDRPPLGEPG